MFSITLNEEFMAKLAFVNTLAPTRDIRYFLNNVHFIISGDTVEIDATDGYILAHSEIKMDVNVDAKIEFCVDVSIIKEFLANAKKVKRSLSLNKMLIDEKGNGKFVSKDDNEYVFENKNCSYPDIHSVLNRVDVKGECCPMSLSIVYFKRMCDAWNQAMNQVVRKKFDSCMVKAETDVSKKNLKYTYEGDELRNTVVLISAK